MKETNWLQEFAEKTYSQAGEEGAIRKAIETLHATNRWCVEFGAWDGIHLSNARQLIEQAGYSAVLIEGDRAKFRELADNYSGNAKVKTLNSYVGFGADDCLDVLLTPLDVPTDFDFLSIDIDGNDYHVWKAMRTYRPKLICIEFNPTIPTEVDFVQPADPNINQGSSLLSLCRLGHEKGYELVGVLHFNAFFVDSQYFHLFEIADNRPETLRSDLSSLTWLFSGYDGSIHIDGSKKLPWHGLEIDVAELQVLPRCIRGYPCVYSRFQRFLYKVFCKYRQWFKQRNKP